MSTYTSNIPQPADNPSDSQDQILQNFQSISTLIGINHVAFNDPDEGKHKFLQMPEEASAPTTGANEGALYTKEQAGATQLFWRNESNGTEQQFTNSLPNIAAPNNDWSFANGLQLRFGTVTHTGTSTPVVFSAAFSNTAYVVLLTPIGAAGLVAGWNAQALTPTGFNMSSSGPGGGNAFYYVAIGS
jgi:hypothetical protein